jgi:micrococcal nuclease
MRLFLKARSALIVSTALTALLLVRFTFAIVKADTFEIDQEGQVNKVIDGDTFDLKSGDKIRLADIDAPESNDPGYQEAKDYLTDLFNQYGWYAFMDVDDITGTDPYGRLVCVAFVSYNGTHYLNVNKAMMETRHAYMDNYANNEFDPYSWQLLVAKSSVVPEFHGLTIMVALTTMAVFAAIARAGERGIRVQGRDKKELTPSRTIFSFSFRYTVQGLLLE